MWLKEGNSGLSPRSCHWGSSVSCGEAQAEQDETWLALQSPDPTSCRKERVRGQAGAHLCEFDDLPRAEAQLLVVVQYRVHVLYPDGVHGPIKHVPLLVRVTRNGPGPDERGENPIRPVTTREERAVSVGEAG